VDLADVVQEDAHQEDVAVDVGINRRDAVRDLEHRDDMFEQPAEVRVVIADARRRPAQPGDEGVVDQEALDEGLHGRVLHLHQRTQTFEQPADVLLGLRQKIDHRHRFLRHLLERGEDHLERALVELHLAFDFEELAGLEALELVLGRVPHTGGNRSRTVAELDLQEVVALAVRPELLVDHHEDFVEAVAVGELLNTTATHAWGPFVRGTN